MAPLTMAVGSRAELDHVWLELAAGSAAMAACGIVFRVVEESIDLPARRVEDARWVAILENAAGATGLDDSGTISTEYEQIFAAANALELQEMGPLVFAVTVSLSTEVDERAFNQWYDQTHVPEVAGAGLTQAHRYRACKLPEIEYLALYTMADRHTLESEELSRVRGFGSFTPHIRKVRRFVLERSGAG